MKRHHAKEHKSQRGVTLHLCDVSGCFCLSFFDSSLEVYTNMTMFFLKKKKKEVEGQMVVSLKPCVNVSTISTAWTSTTGQFLENVNSCQTLSPTIWYQVIFTTQDDKNRCCWDTQLNANTNLLSDWLSWCLYPYNGSGGTKQKTNKKTQNKRLVQQWPLSARRGSYSSRVELRPQRRSVLRAGVWLQPSNMCLSRGRREERLPVSSHIPGALQPLVTAGQATWSPAVSAQESRRRPPEAGGGVPLFEQRQF